MHAEDIPGAPGDRGDRIDVEGRGVRRQNRAGFRHFIEPGEHRTLDVHVLEGRLDDQIAVRHVRIVQGRCQERHALLQGVWRQSSLVHLALVVAAHDAQAPVERLLAALHDSDRNPCVQKGHRDAAAHRSGTDDRYRVHPPGRRSGRDVGDLAGGPLGEERMAQGGRLLSVHQHQERLPFLGQPLLERCGRRLLDQSESRRRRQESSAALAQALARHAQRGRVAGPDIQVADPRERPHGGHPGCEFQRRRHHITLHDPIEEPSSREVSELPRPVRCPAADHVRRHGSPHQAWQPLGAAGAGDECQVHLGEPDPALRRRNPVMGAQRELQSAAETCAVDRGHDGLVRGLQSRDDIAERRLRSGLRRPELGDVGPGGEESLAAGEHDGIDVAGVEGMVQPCTMPCRAACPSPLTGGLSRRRIAVRPVTLYWVDMGGITSLTNRWSTRVGDSRSGG
nr:hypothetical protein [Streptomyces sp. SID5914]